ncbi:hypothetical protein PQQ95_11055 [Paraburkholderia caffeinilytica]
MMLNTLLLFFGATGFVYAAEPRCQSQSNDGHTAKLCVTEAPSQHDYYTLWVDGEAIFMLPDDYIESVTLTHRIPEDAAIEFPLSAQGSPTVTISGGCSPVSEKREKEGKITTFEVSRSCSFTWGNVALLKDLRVQF